MAKKVAVKILLPIAFDFVIGLAEKMTARTDMKSDDKGVADLKASRKTFLKYASSYC